MIFWMKLLFLILYDFNMTIWKNYKPRSQKWKIIQIMILKGVNKWYQDFEVEKCGNIYVWNSSGSRLSELLKAWIVDVVYFENPNAIYKWAWDRAKYSLRSEYVDYYKELYKLKRKFFWLF